MLAPDNKMSDTSASQPLCNDCQALVSWTKRPDIEYWDELRVQFKPNFEALKKSAGSCSLCFFVFKGVFKGKIQMPGGWDDMISYTVQIYNQEGHQKGLFRIGWEEDLPFPTPSVQSIDFYYMTFPSEAIGKRAAWQQSPANFVSRLQTTVADWISNCSKGHKRCGGNNSSSTPGTDQSSVRPSRLLDLSGLNVSHDPKVTLVETASIPASTHIRYATLSHCWGPRTAEPPYKTVKSNRRDHLTQGIHLSRLNRNFRDAVLVCQKLGIGYIWIDSLCIIQDDAEDWQVEAARMCDIYRGTYLNLAAVASPDAHGGIIERSALTLNTEPEKRLSVISYQDKTKPNSKATLLLQPGFGANEWLDDMSVANYPYLGRGWVLQELALSPRTVLFTDKQMYWQCRQCFASEDGTLWSDGFHSITSKTAWGVSPNPSIGMGSSFDLDDSSNRTESNVSKVPLPKDAAAWQTWNMWLQGYAPRSLTYYTDAAPAVAGLVAFFARETGYSPILGLWKETLPFDLNWGFDIRLNNDFPEGEMTPFFHSAPDPLPRAAGAEARDPSKRSDFPSWSWLSVLPFGDIKNMHPASEGIMPSFLATSHYANPPNIPTLRVEHWEEDWAGPTYTSTLRHSKLVVSALVKDAVLTIPAGGFQSYQRSGYSLQLETAGWKREGHDRCRIYHQYPPSLAGEPRKVPVRLVHLYQRFEHAYNGPVDYFLVMIQKGNPDPKGELPRLKRIGNGYVRFRLPKTEKWDREKIAEHRFAETDRRVVELI